MTTTTTALLTGCTYSTAQANQLRSYLAVCLSLSCKKGERKREREKGSPERSKQSEKKLRHRSRPVLQYSRRRRRGHRHNQHTIPQKSSSSAPLPWVISLSLLSLSYIPGPTHHHQQTKAWREWEFGAVRSPNSLYSTVHTIHIHRAAESEIHGGCLAWFCFLRMRRRGMKRKGRRRQHKSALFIVCAMLCYATTTWNPRPAITFTPLSLHVISIRRELIPLNRLLNMFMNVCMRYLYAVYWDSKAFPAWENPFFSL